jgi:hypothetical protein
MLELPPARAGSPGLISLNQKPIPPGKPLNPQGYIGLPTFIASSRDPEIND